MSQLREARSVFANRLNPISSINNGPLIKAEVEGPFHEQIQTFVSKTTSWPRQSIIGLLLVIGLLAFEVFNFDTTQYALLSLLGDVSFLGIRWATILAVAFGAIDFAGLAYLLAPEREQEGQKEVWYLMGAWLLGATMNALMTWWAVSLTLLNHELGNEVLGRTQLIEMVPVFVAVLVWLTRILFIGAFSMAGSQIFGTSRSSDRSSLQGTLSRQSRSGAGAATSGKQHGAAPVRPRPRKSPEAIGERDESFPARERYERFSDDPSPERPSQAPIRQMPRPAARRPLPMAASGRARRRRTIT